MYYKSHQEGPGRVARFGSSFYCPFYQGKGTWMLSSMEVPADFAWALVPERLSCLAPLPSTTCLETLLLVNEFFLVWVAVDWDVLKRKKSGKAHLTLLTLLIKVVYLTYVANGLENDLVHHTSSVMQNMLEHATSVTDSEVFWFLHDLSCVPSVWKKIANYKTDP